MLLGEPLQTAYVTNDMDRAVGVLARQFGVTQFLRRGPVDLQTDAGETMTLALAHAWVGPTWLEIIQPLDGDVGIYRDWLPARDFALRFHHIGIRLPDEAIFDRTRREATQAGHRIAFAMTSPGLPSNVFYVDTARTLGHYIEYIHIPDVSRSTISQMPRNRLGFAAA
jgi:hypothetical protein